jgi:hypothetical protein
MKDGNTYKQILWLSHNDKDDEYDNKANVYFTLKQQIENIKSFRLVSIKIDSPTTTIKVVSNSLSGLTTDRILSSNPAVNDVVFTNDITQSNIYNCHYGRLSKIDLRFYDETGLSLLTDIDTDNWSMCIEFTCYTSS